MTPYYECGEIAIYHGDALELMGALPLCRWFAQALDAVVPRMNPTARVLCFCDDESYPVFYPELYRRFDTMASLIWDKGGIGMGSEWRHGHELIVSARWKDSAWYGGAKLSDVLRVKNVPSSLRSHPVDKPTDLLRQLLKPTTQDGDVVLDPFMGGGSVLCAARLENRAAIGIEIEERYCEIAARRLEQRILDIGA